MFVRLHAQTRGEGATMVTGKVGNGRILVLVLALWLGGCAVTVNNHTTCHVKPKAVKCRMSF